MEFDDLIGSITPEAYQNLKRAVELGKWPDGVRLSQEQREQCMQAVIAYDTKHQTEEERIGQIDRGIKEEGEVCDNPNPAEEVTPVKIIK